MSHGVKNSKSFSLIFQLILKQALYLLNINVAKLVILRYFHSDN